MEPTQSNQLPTGNEIEDKLISKSKQQKPLEFLSLYDQSALFEKTLKTGTDVEVCVSVWSQLFYWYHKRHKRLKICTEQNEHNILHVKSNSDARFQNKAANLCLHWLKRKNLGNIRGHTQTQLLPTKDRVRAPGNAWHLVEEPKYTR